MNTSNESLAYRSFSARMGYICEFQSRGVRKVTTGINRIMKKIICLVLDQQQVQTKNETNESFVCFFSSVLEMRKVSESPSKRGKRYSIVNSLSLLQLDKCMALLQTPHRGRVRIVKHVRGLQCTLKPNKVGGYAQVDMRSLKSAGLTEEQCKGKQLVHAIYWRWLNKGLPIKTDGSTNLSHLDKDTSILNIIQESVSMNESRKYCHLFEWYKPLPGEQAPRCPHKENPCKGP